MTKAPTTARKPIMPRGLRQRERVDGTIRVWWEPTAQARKAGFQAVDFDGNKMDHARREAQRLNAAVATALADCGVRPGPERRSGHTISDLISAYRQSVHWSATLKPKTRDSYGKLLLQIEDKWGTRRVLDFDKAVMSTWYEILYRAKSPRMAQALIRQMSILFALAETKGWRPDNSNPCMRLKIATPAPRDRVATWAEIDAMLAAAERLGLKAVALAIHIGLFQGQRITDILAARRGDFQLRQGADGPVWVWQFTRSKRGNDGLVRLHDDVIPHVRAALADAGTAQKPLTASDALIRDDKVGRAYDEHLFAKRWSQVRDEAAQAAIDAGLPPAIEDLQFRDLRRTFGVLARAGGATKDDTGDVLGNSAANNPQLGETYMPASFTSSSRAVAAVQRPKAATEGKKKA